MLELPQLQLFLSPALAQGDVLKVSVISVCVSILCVIMVVYPYKALFLCEYDFTVSVRMLSQ